MKLIYLWIEEYQYIKKQGYILNACYEVEYDRKKNKLWVSEKDSIDCMLYGDRISVTAIVGDNGAGKSTLLDAIRTVLFDSGSRGRKIKGFLVWENIGRLNLFPFMEDKPSIDSKMLVNERVPNNFNLIYYSDFLDEKYYHEEFDDGDGKDIYIEDGVLSQDRDFVQINISTSYLLKTSGSSVLDFFHGDTRRQLDFYGSLQGTSLLLPFPAPASLTVKIEFLEVDIFDKVLDASLQAYEYKSMGHHGEINSTAYVIGLLKKMESAYQEKIISNTDPLEVEQILQWDIFSEYIYNLLVMRKREHEESHDYRGIDRIIKNTLQENADKDNIWKVLENIFASETTQEKNFEIYLDFYHKTQNMLETPKEGNFSVQFRIPDNMMQILDEHRHFSLKILLIDIYDNAMDAYMGVKNWNGNKDRGMFMDFYDSYMKISHEIDFLKCSWGMSSGESSMFNLFARLYEAMRMEEKENVILIFDGLGASYHPQWQQNIIDTLIQFLRNRYQEKAFQIILTTHSPVLLSDIPKENVIFMRTGNIVETDHIQTFAANIASLYYDSFFMKKGSIGEVAKRSIVNLMQAISELEQKGSAIPDDERIHRLFDCYLRKQYPEYRMEKNREKELGLLQLLVDNIGEDIWRHKANERLHHFLKIHESDRKREIKEQLEKLEREEGREVVIQLVKQWRGEDKE